MFIHFFNHRGRGDDNQLGQPTDDSYRLPKLVEGLQSKKVVDIAAGQRNFLLLTDTGELYYGLITQSSVAAKGSKAEIFAVSALEGKAISGIACSYTNVREGFLYDLFVYIFVSLIFPLRELGALPQRDINTKLATANLSSNPQVVIESPAV